MPYKCAWGCTTYNPNCDACEGTIRSYDPYEYEEVEKQNQIAAINGLTRDEWLELEDE